MKKPQSSHLHRKSKLKNPPRPISSKRKSKLKNPPWPISIKKKKKPNKKSPFSNGYGFSSVLILNFPPNFVRQLSNKARRNCSNIGIAQVAAASWVNSQNMRDGAVASAEKCDAKVRVISDSPSAVLSLPHILWETPSRAVSHDSCPLTVYVASISQVLGLATQASTGFAVADIECSSLILCGRAFADANATRDALVALAAPLISARGGLLLAARLLEAGDSMILLFASEDIIRTCFDLCQALVIRDAGVVLSSDCLVPFPRTRGPAKKFLKKPASVIIASTDSTGVIPSVLKLSSGQAAYHFLASYKDGKFLIAFSRGPSPLDPLVLAKTLLSHLKNNEISSFLINVNSGVLIIDESEQILDMRLVVKGNHLTSQVPIKWKQRTHLDSTWEFYWDLVKGFHTVDLGTRSKLRGGNC